MILSTQKQVDLMRKSWPTFKVLDRTRWRVQWKGALRPLCQTYMVHVLLQREKNYNKSDTLRIPQVTVMAPLLRRRSEDPSAPIPHHYPNQSRPELPILCLYDPATKEWHSGCSVARTIIPWTIDWLACYEGWLATGKWTGGGRHEPAE